MYSKAALFAKGSALREQMEAEGYQFYDIPLSPAFIEYDCSYAPCECCGEGCDPMAAMPTQWQCSSCEQWNDKEQDQ
jgi:hypothetical protein